MFRRSEKLVTDNIQLGFYVASVCGELKEVYIQKLVLVYCFIKKLKEMDSVDVNFCIY